MTMNTFLIWLIPTTPLIIALLILGNQRRQDYLIPLAALPGLILAWWPPLLGETVNSGLLLARQLGIDETGRWFLTLTATLWWIGSLLLQETLKNHPHRRQLTSFFLLTMSGNLGVVLALDIVSFYAFFAIMSFTAYGMIFQSSQPTTHQPSRIYLKFVIAGEMALLAAFLMIVTIASENLTLANTSHLIANSPHSSLIIGLLLFGFGIKTGLLFVHVSLPITYAVLSPAVATVFGGAMLKAGILGWLRVLPLGTVSLPEWGMLLMIMGLIAIFYGVLVGLMQRQPLALLAYSSISQIGLVCVLLASGLLNSDLWTSNWQMMVVRFSIHHAFSKGLLLMGSGLTEHTQGTHRKILLLLLLLPALGLAGAPLTSGMVIKGLMKYNLVSLPLPWLDSLLWLLALSSLTTTLLFARLFWLLWYTPADTKTTLSSFKLWLPIGLLFTCVLVINGIFTGYLSNDVSLTWEKNWGWLLGLLISIIIFTLARPGRSYPSLPPGDMFWLSLPIYQRIIIVGEILLRKGKRLKEMIYQTSSSAWSMMQTQLNWLDKAEISLRRGTVSGVFILLLIILLFTITLLLEKAVTI